MLPSLNLKEDHQKLIMNFFSKLKIETNNGVLNIGFRTALLKDVIKFNTLNQLQVFNANENQEVRDR